MTSVAVRDRKYIDAVNPRRIAAQRLDPPF
jgi:hypothetical protein